MAYPMEKVKMNGMTAIPVAAYCVFAKLAERAVINMKLTNMMLAEDRNSVLFPRRLMHAAAPVAHTRFHTCKQPVMTSCLSASVTPTLIRMGVR